MNHWNQKEVEKASRILIEAEKHKKTSIRLLDEAVHWLILLVVVFGNLLMTGFLVLSWAFWGSGIFYTLSILLALGFGFLVELPLQDLEKLDKHKHLLSKVLLPVLAIVNVYFFIGLKGIFQENLGIVLGFEPIFAGLLYAVSFLLPHAVLHYKRTSYA